MSRLDVFRMVKRRVKAAELGDAANCHLLNGGTLERATTQIYDRTADASADRPQPFTVVGVAANPLPPACLRLLLTLVRPPAPPPPGRALRSRGPQGWMLGHEGASDHDSLDLVDRHQLRPRGRVDVRPGQRPARRSGAPPSKSAATPTPNPAAIAVRVRVLVGSPRRTAPTVFGFNEDRDANSPCARTTSSSSVPRYSRRARRAATRGEWSALDGRAVEIGDVITTDRGDQATNVRLLPVENASTDGAEASTADADAGVPENAANEEPWAAGIRAHLERRGWTRPSTSTNP